MKPVSVFLVDDHALVREGIRRLLEPEEGIVVVGEAGSAEECFARVGAQAVDVVLMDIRLTGMDGIEATRQLRVSHSELKVLVLSAFGDKYPAQAIEAGASGYMLKSATRSELARAVVQAAGGLWPMAPELPPIVRYPARLSSRQREILELISNGVSSDEIKRTVCVSRQTVDRDKREIYDLLGVNGQTHAVAEAIRRGLIK